MKNKTKKPQRKSGAYQTELGTKKKTGLSSEQIKSFFGDATGILVFMGKNRQTRRNPIELPDGRYTRTTRAGIVKPLFMGKHKNTKARTVAR